MSAHVRGTEENSTYYIPTLSIWLLYRTHLIRLFDNSTDDVFDEELIHYNYDAAHKRLRPTPHAPHPTNLAPSTNDVHGGGTKRSAKVAIWPF